MKVQAIEIVLASQAKFDKVAAALQGMKVDCEQTKHLTNECPPETVCMRISPKSGDKLPNAVLMTLYTMS